MSAAAQPLPEWAEPDRLPAPVIRIHPTAAPVTHHGRRYAPISHTTMLDGIARCRGCGDWCYQGACPVCTW